MSRSSALCSAAALVVATLVGAPLLAPSPAHAQIDVGVDFSTYAPMPPPPLPVYDQPPLPEEGDIWVPGYWAWDDSVQDYYWVPGAWVEPPEPGLLWTPGYWAWDEGRYGFVPGYWGPEVGWYGGVDYGFGYDGYGYEGGYWQGRRFFYNRSANNVFGRNVETFDRPVHRFDRPRASFNGPGGVAVRPSPDQLASRRGPHVAPTQAQRAQAGLAARQPDLRASANGGRPPIAATARPGVFEGPGVVRGAPGAGSSPAPHGPGTAAGRTYVPESHFRGVAPAPDANRGGVLDHGGPPPMNRAPPQDQGFGRTAPPAAYGRSGEAPPAYQRAPQPAPTYARPPQPPTTAARMAPPPEPQARPAPPAPRAAPPPQRSAPPDDRAPHHPPE